MRENWANFAIAPIHRINKALLYKSQSIWQLNDLADFMVKVNPS
jgi:hypothetical protein